MESLLVTQITVISSIFGIVVLIALFNIFNINYQYKKLSKAKKKPSELYDIKKRNKI